MFARPALVGHILLLFHTVWATALSVLYVLLFRDALTFLRAFWLAFALWILVLVFFFPVVGWGFLGLAVSPKLIVAATVPRFVRPIPLGLCPDGLIKMEPVADVINTCRAKRLGEFSRHKSAVGLSRHPCSL